MRYMLIVKATGYTEAGITNGRKHSEAMAAYKEALAGAGALLASEQLQPSFSGMRILYPANGERPEIVFGPFPVDQQLIGGYMLIDAATEEEAIQWALRMPVPEGRGAHEIELRKLEESPDRVRDPRALAMETDLKEQIGMI